MGEPLVDEIRAARAVFEQARQAASDVAEVNNVLIRIRTNDPVPEYDLWYTTLAARWGLAAHPQSAEVALAGARAALAKAAASFPDASARLGSLRAQQKKLLEAPECSESLALFEFLLHESGRVANECSTLTRRANTLRPLARILIGVLATVASEIASPRTPRGPVQSIAALRAIHDPLIAVTSTVGVLLEIPTPSQEISWDDLEPLERAYRGYLDHLTAVADEAEAQRIEREAEYKRLTARLHERFG